MKENNEIAIIGAGLAGLTAALTLHRAGKKVVVYEAKENVGGRVATEFIDGFKLDKGFQVLLTGYPICQELLNYSTLKLHNFLRGALIRHQGQFIRLIDPSDDLKNSLSSLFSPIVGYKDFVQIPLALHRVLTEVSPHAPQKTSITAKQKLNSFNFSKSLTSRFLEPFFKGILLDPHLNCPGTLVEYTMLMFIKGQTAIPAKGMQAIPQQLADTLPRGTVKLNKKVHLVENHQVQFSDGLSCNHSQILIAADPWSAAKILRKPPPPPGRTVYVVYFDAPESPVNDAMIVLNGDEVGYVNHLAVLSDVCPSYAPGNRSLIAVNVLDDQDYNGIEKKSIDFLKGWFGDKVKHWRHIKTYAIPNAHPYQFMQTQTFKLEDGLYATGDYYESPSIQSAMAMGQKAAKQMMLDDE